jgi:putative transcriptional regulator
MNRAKIAVTSENDIRRQQIEDGEDPNAPLPPFRAVPNVRAIRTRLQMTQEAFAAAIGVPVATVRNWEQSRTAMDPAVRSPHVPIYIAFPMTCFFSNKEARPN